MSAHLLALLDALARPFVKEPITGRSAVADFGPPPAAVQRQRLVAAEAAFAQTGYTLDDRTHELHELLAVAWHMFCTDADYSYDRVNNLLDEIETILATPYATQRAA